MTFSHFGLTPCPCGFDGNAQSRACFWIRPMSFQRGISFCTHDRISHAVTMFRTIIRIGHAGFHLGCPLCTHIRISQMGYPRGTLFRTLCRICVAGFRGGTEFGACFWRNVLRSFAAISVVAEVLTSIQGDRLDFIGERFLFVIRGEQNNPLDVTAALPNLADRAAFAAVTP